MKNRISELVEKYAYELVKLLYYVNLISIPSIVIYFISSFFIKGAVINIGFITVGNAFSTKINGNEFHIKNITGDLVITNASSFISLVSSAYLVVLVVSSFIILKQLKIFVESYYLDGNPFIKENSIRLKRIAFILFAIPLINLIKDMVIISFLPKIILFNNSTLISNSNVWIDDLKGALILIVVGLVILLIAKSFEYGTKLKQENDLTV